MSHGFQLIQIAARSVTINNFIHTTTREPGGAERTEAEASVKSPRDSCIPSGMVTRPFAADPPPLSQKEVNLLGFDSRQSAPSPPTSSSIATAVQLLGLLLQAILTIWHKYHP